jgi:hypothetical protein
VLVIWPTEEVGNGLISGELATGDAVRPRDKARAGAEAVRVGGVEAGIRGCVVLAGLQFGNPGRATLFPVITKGRVFLAEFDRATNQLATLRLGCSPKAAKYMRELNPDAKLVLFGQDYNAEAYSICGSDMLIKGEEIDNIQFGDSLGDGKTVDAFPSKKFDYMLANPPFGVKWESEEDTLRKEYETRGF